MVRLEVDVVQEVVVVRKNVPVLRVKSAVAREGFLWLGRSCCG